jgi:hypothetical protein
MSKKADLVYFSKQIISSRFRTLLRFGQVFDKWKSLEAKVSSRKDIVEIIQVKTDLPFIVPFLAITPLTLMLSHPLSVVETLKTVGLGLSLTVTSLLILPTLSLTIPSTIPTELQQIYYTPYLNNLRTRVSKDLFTALQSLLPPHKQPLLETSPNWISLLSPMEITTIPTKTLTLLLSHYGIILPRIQSTIRIYQYLDWILTDTLLISTQKPRLDVEELIKCLSDRGYFILTIGYNTSQTNRLEMEVLLKEYLMVFEGLRRGRDLGVMSVDEKFEVFVILTLLALKQ